MKKFILVTLSIAVIGTALLIGTRASTSNVALTANSERISLSGKAAICDDAILFGQNCTPSQAGNAGLELIKNSTIRNTNHDNSKFISTASAALPKEELYTSYKDYAVDSRAANGGFLKGLDNAGQFRVVCEFSHFAYDDPIVFPGQPGVSHLHMFFGNTHANGNSTYDSIVNSGSSTCNGQELNRTSYWVPALLDQSGDARVPDRLLVYYKAYNDAVGSTEVYPENTRIISGNALATSQQPGAKSSRELFFRCYKNGTSTGDLTLNPKSVTIPTCPATHQLEMNIKFQTCWNGKDPSNYKDNLSFSNVWPTSGSCPASHPKKFPQMEYRIFFNGHEGKSKDWYLSSDVSPADKRTINPSGRGFSLHGDWFGGWNKDVNKLWIDNCVNVFKADCDGGLLADARIQNNPKALKIRPEYTGPLIFKNSLINEQLCPGRTIEVPSQIAYCTN